MDSNLRTRVQREDLDKSRQICIDAEFLANPMGPSFTISLDLEEKVGRGGAWQVFVNKHFRLA